MGDFVSDRMTTFVATSNAGEKPILVITAFSLSGHMAGCLQFAKYFYSKGYKDIYFLAGAKFRTAVQDTGATFVNNPWNWEDFPIPDHLSKVETMFWTANRWFIDSIPVTHRALKQLLEDVREKHPTRQVVIIHESMSQGLGPFCFGAPLPKGYTSLPKVINFHTIINTQPDPTIPAFGPTALEYDPTPENMALWKQMRENVKPGWKNVTDRLNSIYASLDATARTRTGNVFVSELVTFGDVTLIATSPSLDYPRPNLDTNKIRYIGGLPLSPVDPNFCYPSWWSELKENASLPPEERKKVVFVTQGTVDRNYQDLLLPAIRALASRDDLIVVATLGAKNEASPLSEDETPRNARVIDYLPYDAILPFSDVFISNAGYGGFMHGVMNGVPMILAGIQSDKPEVCMRAEWAGVAVNMRTEKPSEDQLREAVDKVLGEEKYKRRVMEIKRENEALDSMSTVERLVEEFGKAEEGDGDGIPRWKLVGGLGDFFLSVPLFGKRFFASLMRLTFLSTH